MERRRVTSPLVFLHGFLGNPSDFTRVAEVATQLSGPRTVTGLALAGHPEVPPTRDAAANAAAAAGFEAELNRLATLIAERHSEPVDLVGYSMGGRLALGLAIEHPRLVRRLVLVSSRRGLDDETERKVRQSADEAWAQQLEQTGLEGFLRKWWDQPLFVSLKDLPASRLESEFARRRSLNPLGLAWALRYLGLGCQPSYAAEVKRLTIPVTLVVGGLDAKFQDCARKLVEQFPIAQAVVVKGHGHHLLIEAPEAVGRAIAEEQPS